MKDLFLGLVKEKLAEWSGGTVDLFAPKLFFLLSELVQKGETRDETVIEFLRKVTLRKRGRADKLLDLLDGVDQRNRARLIVAERAPVDLLEGLLCEAISYAKRPYSREGEAARILRRALSESLHLPVARRERAASADASVSCSVKAFELLTSSHVALRPVAPSIGKPLLTEMMSLLHRIVRCEGDSFPYGSLLSLNRQDKPESLDADDAGKAIGKMLTAIVGLDEELVLQDWDEIMRLIAKGDSDRSLPSVLGPEPALLRGSEGFSFAEGLFSEVPKCSGKEDDLVKGCFAALVNSYDNPTDCLLDLSAVPAELRDANAGIRRLVSDESLALCEMMATGNEEAKLLPPPLRIFLASNLFLPEYPLESFQWITKGLKGLCELTSVHEPGGEFLTFLTRIGYCLGRIVVLGQCDDDVLSATSVHIWHVLLELAEFEYHVLTAPEDETFKSIILSHCAKIECDLTDVVRLLKDGTAVPSPQNGNRPMELARSLKSSLQRFVESLSCDEADGNPVGISDCARVLRVATGIAWKLGLDKNDALRTELCEALHQLTPLADMSELRSEDSILELDESFEFKLFVSSLSAVDRQEALRFVVALAGRRDKSEDFGLFDELLLQDPDWVFLNAERIGGEDEISKRVAHLLERLSEEAPDKVESLAEVVEDMCARHDSWMFRFRVKKALGSALAKKDPERAGNFSRHLPEFWSRSKVGAEMALTVWERDPMEALAQTKEIELAQIRAETMREFAKRMAGADKALSSVEIAQKMFLICTTLKDPEERFLAARDIALTAFRGNQKANDTAVIEIVHSFLELFTSTSVEWLELAYLHVAPLLSSHLEVREAAGLSDNILCSKRAARKLVSEWPKLVATSFGQYDKEGSGYRLRKNLSVIKFPVRFCRKVYGRFSHEALT